MSSCLISKTIKCRFFSSQIAAILPSLGVGIIKWFKGYWRQRFVELIPVNTENKLEYSFKAVNVKKAYGNVTETWWKITEKKIRNYWKKTCFCIMEDKESDCDENSIYSDLFDDQQCVLNLANYLTNLM